MNRNKSRNAKSATRRAEQTLIFQKMTAAD